MSKTEKKALLYDSMEKTKKFDMEKIDIYFNNNDMLCIRDYTHKVFYNGIAVLNTINTHEKTITLDILKPNYLIHDTMILTF